MDTVISEQVKDNNTDIFLSEENNNVKKLLKVFNEYYVNVTKEISDDDTILQHSTMV